MKLVRRSGPRVSLVGPPVFLGLLGALTYALLRHRDLFPALKCPWRHLAGIECPFCGTTTTLRHLLHLRPLDAIVTNPAVAVMTVLAVLVVVNELAGLLTRRRLALVMSRKEGWAMFALVMASVAANWIYVLFLRGSPPAP